MGTRATSAVFAAKPPFADLSKFESNPEVGHISDLFTVELIANYIKGKLATSSN